MLTFESSEFHTKWFALHRIPDTFVSLTTWAPSRVEVVLMQHGLFEVISMSHVACLV